MISISVTELWRGWVYLTMKYTTLSKLYLIYHTREQMHCFWIFPSCKICKHYQASHLNNDEEKEYPFYDGPLNTVSMGQYNQDLQCVCSEDITVLHFVTGIFQEIHATSSCTSFTLCKLKYCYYHYMSITYSKTILSLFLKYCKCHCFILSPQFLAISLSGINS